MQHNDGYKARPYRYLSYHDNQLHVIGRLGAVAPICNKCKGVGYYYINGVKYSCSQCGGLGRDWNSC